MHSGNFRLPQTGSFALAEGMVRFQLDFTDITQGIRQLPDSGQMFNAVIDAGNQGAAQNYVSSRPVQPMKILQNRSGRNAGEPRMIFRTGFDVPQPEVDRGHEAHDLFRRSEAAGFQAGVQIVPAGGLEQSCGELDLRQRFAAGKRDPASGFLIEQLVLENFGDHLFHAHDSSDALQRSGMALCGTSAASVARFPMEQAAAAAHLVTMPGAGGKTATAAEALFRTEKNFRPAGLGFRIVAPEAAQRTTLQKHGCPDSGTVVQREFADVEDHSVHRA